MDYYQTLGVGRNATQDEIKKAYRSLAMKHHPDRGGDTNTFKKIQEAYATLSDDQKKAAYDNPQPQFGGPEGFSFHFGGPGGFEQMFGNGHPFGDIFGFRQARRQVNQSLQLQTSINLEDAYYGKELLANLRLPSGREQTVNIKIPQGIHEGTTLRLSGMGDDSIAGLPRGDLLLTVHIQDHPVFKRQGDDLLVDHEITSIEAMIGTTITISGLDGKRLETNIPAGVQFDSILALAGHGMPNFNDPSRKGRLLVKIKIRTPGLTEDQKEYIKKLNIR
jgi:curved DNA-binding protein